MALYMLGACDAGHLGNSLTRPVRGVGAALGNPAHDARRARLSEYLTANAAVEAEALSAPGSALTGLVETADVPAAALPILIRDPAEISAALPPIGSSGRRAS